MHLIPALTATPQTLAVTLLRVFSSTILSVHLRFFRREGQSPFANLLQNEREDARLFFTDGIFTFILRQRAALRVCRLPMIEQGLKTKTKSTRSFLSRNFCAAETAGSPTCYRSFGGQKRATPYKGVMCF